MFYKKRRSYGKRSMFSKRRSYKKRRLSQKPIQRVVRNILSRTLETKHTTETYTLTDFNSGINVSGDNLQVLPDIQNGTEVYDRIGTKIKPVSLTIRGYAVYRSQLNGANDYVLDAHMLGARLFVYQNRRVPSTINGNSEYSLLVENDAYATFDGSATRFNAPVNRENFKFFADKKHVFMKPYGVTDIVNAGQVPSSTGAITGMDKSLFWPFTIYIPASKMPSVLIYDADRTTPNNFNPRLSFGYVHLLGLPADVSSTLLKMTFTVDFKFKDA